ncbi:MAG: ABC transporter permease [Clostridium sp.]|nr:ABC transporter permease [Clostridium sp.]
MTIFSMTLNNIKKNFKNYSSYFLSLSFSVFVVYLFMSILNNRSISNSLGSHKSFLNIFNMATYMIVLFSAFFIWYSNSFFVKSRKKEFATYMILGMSKKQIAKLNFFENVVIMVMSLGTGIVLGIIFTKFFIMLLFLMMKVKSAVAFEVNLKALKQSLIIFAVIFAAISIHGFILVQKSNLIDLLKASKKVERGLKVSFKTLVLGILSVILMAYGYYIAAKQLASNIMKAPLVLGLIVVGTILFITSFVSMIIYINKKNEPGLFKGTKLISNAQLNYRYRGNVGALSIIAISTTIALCALTTCVGSYAKAVDNARSLRPFSVEYYNVNNAQQSFNNILSRHKEISVKYKDNVELLSIDMKDPVIGVNENYYILNESTFNNINAHQNVNRRAKLKNKNDCYFVGVNTFSTNKTAINKIVDIKTTKGDFNLKVTQTDNNYFIALEHFKQTVVVKDSVYREIKQGIDEKNIVNIKGYMLKNDFKSGSFVKDLIKELPKDSKVLTFYDNYEDGLKLLGMMAFIGLFMGAVFVTATGSIIYFKIIMQAREDKDKFVTLRKIGVSKREIKNAISKELRLLFGVPLLIAGLNSYFYTITFSKILTFELMNQFIIIFIAYAVVYCIYYFITLKSYSKIVIE